MALDKRQPYETDVRVPFFARGPGIPAGSTVASGALVSVDLAPTLLQLSGAWSRDAIEALGMDGQPLAAMLTQAEAPLARDFLVEYFGESVDYCASSLEGAFPARGWSTLDGRLCPVRLRPIQKTRCFWRVLSFGARACPLQTASTAACAATGRS